MEENKRILVVGGKNIELAEKIAGLETNCEIIYFDPTDKSEENKQFLKDICISEEQEHLIKDSKYLKIFEENYDMIKMAEDFKYSHLSKKEREANIVPIRNSTIDPKHERNKSCPCGSGKKYKTCCLK